MYSFTIGTGGTPNGLESGAPNALSNMSWLFAAGAEEKASLRRPGAAAGAGAGAALGASSQEHEDRRHVFLIKFHTHIHAKLEIKQQ